MSCSSTTNALEIVHNEPEEHSKRTLQAHIGVSLKYLWIILIPSVLLPNIAIAQPSTEEYLNPPVTVLPIQTVQKPKPKPLGYNPCSCVSYTKYRTGFTQSVGNAKNWPRNTDSPLPGGVVVFGGTVGHVMYIERVEGTTIYISDSNNTPCKLTHRTIQTTDSRILGYWR